MDKLRLILLSVYLGLFVTIFLIISCDNSAETNKPKQPSIEIEQGKIGSFEIVVIDGCEYIKTYYDFGLPSYTHKGNCTNIIHKCGCK